MALGALRTPSYRLHKPTGQAVVTLNGRDFYLGRFGSPESRAEYDRTIVEWISNGRRLPAPTSGAGSDLRSTKLALAYLTFADSYYSSVNFRLTSLSGGLILRLHPMILEQPKEVRRGRPTKIQGHFDR